MMPRKTPKANSSHRHSDGFSAVELLIMATIITIVTAFGLMGITRARATVRLSGAAREYASYIEKARIHSIRTHADDASERANVSINVNKTSYDVTLDLDGDGGMDTRTITLPSDISFDTVESIAFDWRGRTLSTVGGVTTANAQVSIRLLSSDDAISVDVTGSGDITIDSRVFDDSVPNVTLKVGDLAAGATPVPTPVSGASPTPTPTPSGPLPDLLPSPTPILGDILTDPTPTPTPTPTPDPTPTPIASPTPEPTPTPTPVAPCTITTDKALVILGLDGTATINVSHSSDTSVSITGSSSKPSDLQVTPGGAQVVGSGSTTTFTLKSKRAVGTYSVTFTAGCGSKNVPVTVAL